MTFKHIAIINIFIILLLTVFSTEPWYSYILTLAQLVYVPLTLHIIIKNDEGKLAKLLPFISIFGIVGVIILHFTSETSLDLLFAFLYFIFTLFVAWYGIFRFMQRGFAHFEEFMIDMGLVYLMIGGGWFFAHISDIDTGFSPILTWLTSVHFHYASFLLPIFVGFLGRVYKSPIYKGIGTIILLSPIIVALGITYSTIIELFGTILYIVGIYGLIFLSLKLKKLQLLQKIFVRISFGALGISILFSLVYAFGNLSGLYFISIEFMIRFHGIINCLFFALFGIVGWVIKIPISNQRNMNFPISRIKGKSRIGESVLTEIIDDKTYTGLVDDMRIYHVNSETIGDFYENTNDYRLFAEVNWYTWFKPLAKIYRLLSKHVEQINLPLTNEQIEMTGEIRSVKERIDGRNKPRAWIRKTNQETIFVALYSYHDTDGRTYMNIALPLPWSAMIGILELNELSNSLELTSKRKHSAEADSGIYLAMKNSLFKLPIEEQFLVSEAENGILNANHKMWIFSIPFLSIDYVIQKKEKPG